MFSSLNHRVLYLVDSSCCFTILYIQRRYIPVSLHFTNSTFPYPFSSLCHSCNLSSSLRSLHLSFQVFQTLSVIFKNWYILCNLQSDNQLLFSSVRIVNSKLGGLFYLQVLFSLFRLRQKVVTDITNLSQASHRSQLWSYNHTIQRRSYKIVEQMTIRELQIL